jgi:phosphoglycolate phosphatase-like HAD superfamily hydrolase
LTEAISPDPLFEILNPAACASEARVALFDFDGTLSLLRAGWANVMVPMMVRELAGLNSGESEATLESIVREFVDRLTGKQTIYQTIELARQVELRGGVAKDPLDYKRQYLDLLGAKIEYRLEEVRSGNVPPEKYLVPGAIRVLEDLRARGLRLYLASGTDEPYMRMEADLLGVTPYFDGGVFGALDDYKSFSKRILIQRILDRSECHGQQILGFGDGYVEIENVKGVGGVAIGVATDEGACLRVDAWKRDRLVKAGADCIIPNYLQWDQLAGRLFSK